MMRFIDGKMNDVSVVDAIKSDSEKGRAFARDRLLLMLAMDCPRDVEQLFGDEIRSAVKRRDWAR